MDVIRRLNLRARLLLLLFLVLAPLMFLLGDKLNDEIDSRQELVGLNVELRKGEEIINLIHELQKERGLSISFITVKGGSFKERLAIQREVVDNQIEITSRLFESNSQIMIYLSDLIQTRQQVYALALQPLEAKRYFTNLISSLTRTLSQTLTRTSNPNINQYITSQIRITVIKEELSRIASAVMGLPDAKRIDLENYANLVRRKGAFEDGIADFRRIVPPDVLDYFAARMNDDTVRYTFQALQRLEEGGVTDSLLISRAEFYEYITTTTERIRQVEMQLIKEMEFKAENQLRKTTTSLILYITISFSIILTALIIALYIIRMVTKSARQLREAAEKISKGITDVDLNIREGGELGDLAKSFNLVLSNYIDLANSAELMGSGNYEVDVNIRSHDDVLGRSLENMRLSLKKATRESSESNFIQSGALGLNDLLTTRQPKDLQQLAQQSLDFIATYTNAGAGALYFINEMKALEASASFAIDTPITSASFTNSLCSEVIRTGEPLIISKVPEDFYQISTGSGATKPFTVMIFPLGFAEERIGAIELAFLQTPGEKHQKLISQLSEKIALAAITLRSRIRTEELLYRSQQQAEELEAQQEELRQVNEELSENTKMLQASEEELKVQQEELQEKNRELEEKTYQLTDQNRTVNRKNQEIEEARTQLEKKNQQLESTSKYKSEFLANMSHELRTPLNSILILTRMLAENKQGNLSEKQVEFAETIYRSGNDLLKLINEILDLSKIEAGKINVNPAWIDPRDPSFTELFHAVAKEKKIKFKVQVEKDVPAKIFTDSDRLGQILRNLLSNAFKFTEEKGEVMLRVYCPSEGAAFRNPSLKSYKDVIAFEVKDTGIGIPQDKLDIVFEAFQQADSSTSRKYGGTGLGLSISKELATVLGGEIELKSEAGKGSIFTVFLPMEFQEKDPEPLIPMPAEPAHEKPEIQSTNLIIPESKNEILIVEDDANFANLLVDLSSEHGQKTFTVTTGKAALDYLKSFTPIGILLDIGLPDISGKLVLDFIRETPRLAEVPHYILSGREKEEIGLGTHVKFLQKPIEKSTLESTIQEVIDSVSGGINHLLIVDDDPENINAVSEALCVKGLECESAISAEEAYEKASQKKYDCVILDINLPEMNGFDLLKKLKKLPGYHRTPLLVLTDKDITEDEEKEIRRFSSSIIVKSSASFQRLSDDLKSFLGQPRTTVKKPTETVRKPHTLSGKTALVVDDDIRNIYALSSVLEEEGMKVISAGNGEEALSKIKPGTIDIVLMDIMMPVMDGYDAMKAIRKQPELQDLPIIALTARAMPGDKARCIQAGASDYIPKPVNTDQLLPLMKVWLYQ